MKIETSLPQEVAIVNLVTSSAVQILQDHSYDQLISYEQRTGLALHEIIPAVAGNILVIIRPGIVHPEGLHVMALEGLRRTYGAQDKNLSRSLRNRYLPRISTSERLDHVSARLGKRATRAALAVYNNDNYGLRHRSHSPN